VVNSTPSLNWRFILMKIKSSSTQIFYGRKGGGLYGGSGGGSGGSRQRPSGQASYGASGFGSGGQAKSGKSRKSPQKVIKKKK